MHTRVLDRWEVDVIFFLAVGEFDFGGFELALRALRYLLLVERYAALLANLLVQFNHVGLGIVTVALIIALLVNENLAPERVLSNVDALLWLEEGAAGELLLPSLLPSLDDPGALLLDSRDQAF